MDYIWTPWRYRYIADAGKIAGCVFCEAPAANRDVETLIVLRGKKNYVILNRYPYTSGHVMIVPYAHTADFGQLDPETSAEIMRLAQRMQSALDTVYHPEGYNLGMNLAAQPARASPTICICIYCLDGRATPISCLRSAKR